MFSAPFTSDQIPASRPFNLSPGNRYPQDTGPPPYSQPGQVNVIPSSHVPNSLAHPPNSCHPISSYTMPHPQSSIPVPVSEFLEMLVDAGTVEIESDCEEGEGDGSGDENSNTFKGMPSSPYNLMTEPQRHFIDAPVVSLGIQFSSSRTNVTGDHGRQDKALNAPDADDEDATVIESETSHEDSPGSDSPAYTSKSLKLRQLRQNPGWSKFFNIAQDLVLGYVLLTFAFPTKDKLTEYAGECFNEAKVHYAKRHPDLPLNHTLRKHFHLPTYSTSLTFAQSWNIAHRSSKQ